MMQGRGWIALSALLLCSVGVTAQGPRGFGGRGGFGPGPGKVVTGEAFTATSTSISTEKLADGTTITHNSTLAEARDSQGRSARTVTNAATGTSGTTFSRTTVMDPVAHTVTDWGTQSKVATVMQLPNFPGGGRGGNWNGGGGPNPGGPHPGGPGAGGPRASSPENGGRPHAQVTREVLPSKSIAGVTAEGVKTTITVPAGAEGNDKPIVSTREVWTSPDLKIVLLEISNDPRDGYHKMEVTSLLQGEPDPGLFQVPNGYTVKQETRHRGR